MLRSLGGCVERFTCDAVVVGAGVVGLAIGRALALSGRETLILERNPKFGMETSSRNSEVVHAGIYYPTGSLKARHCRRGRDLLYAYCEKRGISAPRIGKLIVATNGTQEKELAAIKAQAEANGVEDMGFLSRENVHRLEPELAPSVALISPSTGIVDSHQFMLSLLGEAEAAGAELAVNSVVGSVETGPRHVLRIRSGSETFALDAELVINSAGLWAPSLARRTSGLAPRHIPTAHFAKGNYARLNCRSPFKRLIYPVPEPGGLGIHLTLDLNGQARFGPNVQWLDETDPAKIDMTVDASICEPFAMRIKDYWPGIRPEDLVPDYAGIRPKTTGRGEPAADFRIDGVEVHQIAGLINLFGIESPGLTASLSIAESVIASL